MVFGQIAQSVEHPTHNGECLGSSPGLTFYLQIDPKWVYNINKDPINRNKEESVKKLFVSLNRMFWRCVSGDEDVWTMDDYLLWKEGLPTGRRKV